MRSNVQEEIFALGSSALGSSSPAITGGKRAYLSASVQKSVGKNL